MRIFILVFTFIIISSSIYAQPLRDFSIGPYFALKAGINGGLVMDGRRNGISFNGIPDFGAQFFIPASAESDLGFTIDLGYSTYSYIIEGVNVDKKYTMKYHYVTLNPNFYFHWFMIGMNFGFPASANFGESIGTDILEMMVEFKLSGMFPLMTDESGSLNLNLQAGYMLTGIYKDFAKNDPLLPYIPEVPPETISSKFNPRAVSVSLGLSYLMNLSPSEVEINE